MTYAADIETIECIRHPDGQRFENLLADGLVIAEREIGTLVWLEVLEEEEPQLFEEGQPRPCGMARN